MNTQSELYKGLDYDKVEINWNKNPIKMDTFLGFLTVPTDRSKNHLGVTTGWTQYNSESLNLIIGGGVVKGVEYLDSIQFGKNLDNSYNNYVTPFHLHSILTVEGIKFFVDYYKDEIEAFLLKKSDAVSHAEKSLITARKKHSEALKEIEQLKS